MFTEGIAAPESEHHVHRATLIDYSASARSFTADSKKSMYEWARTRDGLRRRTARASRRDDHQPR